jgi:hypothetical protein
MSYNDFDALYPRQVHGFESELSSEVEESFIDWPWDPDDFVSGPFIEE